MMLTSETKVRVRYAETDQMGYVYYGNYAAYYEVGRVETMRKTGFSYQRMESSGVMMPVLDCQSKYFLPAKYDEELTVSVKVPELPQVRIRFEYEIFNPAHQLINRGATTLAFVDRQTHKACRAPKAFLEALTPYYTK